MLFLSEDQSMKIRIMTFNIATGVVSQGENSWDNRKAMVIEVIKNSGCDFIGLQEALIYQSDEIMEALPDYRMIRRTQEISPYEGESCPILYDASHWTLIDQNTLWFSDTPELPGSRGWDISKPAIFTMGVFENKQNGNHICIYNTRYDPVSVKAREKSSAVLVRHILRNHAHDKIAILGDLNCSENEWPVQYLLTNSELILHDSYRLIHKNYAPGDETYFGWGAHSPGNGSRNDYIFVTWGIKVNRVQIIHYSENNRFPSDHCPVFAEIEIP